MSLDVTVTDLFCGAGGSSIGAEAAGARLRMAANHWAMAIETHAGNFPNADHDCFPAGTLVLTSTGHKPIETVEQGDLVLTHLGRWQPVIRRFHTVDNTVLVRPMLHAPGIEVTPNHQFWVKRGRLSVAGNDNRRDFGAPSWLPIEHAIVDTVRRAGHERDALAQPVYFGELDWLRTPDALGAPDQAWWLIGRWLGDGSSGTRNNDVTISCADDEVPDLGLRIPPTWRIRRTGTAHHFYTYDIKLATWLRDAFGSGAANKTIPGWALCMPDDYRTALLDGYLSADGSDNGKITRSSTVSKSLALGVRSLALSLGHRASLHYANRGTTCLIEGRVCTRLPAWSVNWMNAPAHETAGTDDLHCWALLQSVAHAQTKVDVYTLEVAVDHSYVADGIVVKNCADVSQVDPRRYPTTDVLIASPECTNHSQAKSNRHDANLFDPVGDPAAERSRATMWDVPRFAERHRYQIVVVENVVEVRRWAPFSAWLAAMEALGYRHQIVYLNSMVAPPTPQSRDRVYVVFWRDGNRAPDLDIRPRAYCRAHGDVEAVQRWKRPERPGGKFRAQYLYRCPTCHEVAAPYAWPAASAIDWALPAQRIGDRAKALAPATMRRIKVGLERYGSAIVQKSGHTYVRAWPLDGPIPTQTTETHHALACPPFMLAQYDYKGGDQRRVYGVDQPLRTVVADGNHHALVTPLAFIAELRGGGSDASRVEDPLSTVTASGNHHALVVKNYGDGHDPSMTKPVTSPFGTVTTQDHHALLALPFLTSYYGNGGSSPVVEPVPTVTTHDRHGLVEPTAVEVEDCGFRMLEPHEIGRAMAFPDSYVVVGNKRQRVRQYGNAVTPPVMSLILERAIASLRSEGAE